MKTKPLVQNPHPQRAFVLIVVADTIVTSPPGKVPKHKNPNSWEQIKMGTDSRPEGSWSQPLPFLDGGAAGELKHEEEDKWRMWMELLGRLIPSSMSQQLPGQFEFSRLNPRARADLLEIWSSEDKGGESRMRHHLRLTWRSTASPGICQI